MRGHARVTSTGALDPEQVTGHLPLEITTIVGRRQETADIRGLMASHRLVTLTGPAGIGKTRTALHVARSARRTFADGAWFIELDSLRDPALVPQVVLETLKVPDVSARDPRAVLIDFLRSRQVLLVMDNCEHLLAEVAALVEAVLEEVAGAHVLATSLQPLGVPGEATYRIDPLAVPGEGDVTGVQDLSGFAAVELFTTRARAALGQFEVDASNQHDVVRLCAKLEGLPLALELAASRLKVMTIEELLRRLDDRFRMLRGTSPVRAPRHQTLLAAVSWSHDLCTPAEQLLWRRASVFPGTFSLDAAETICSGGDLPGDHVMDALLGLVDKSVVINEQRNGRVRFRMLETIRDFGAERLAAAGETEELRAAQCAWVSGLLAEAAAGWFGPRQAEAAVELRIEQANIRSALDFCATRDERARTGQQMAGESWFLWVACGFLSEGRMWLERLLAADPQPSVDRALALGATAWVAALQGEAERGSRAAAECEELAQRLGEPALAAYGVNMRALSAFFANQADQAEELFRRARTRYAEADAPQSWQLLLLIQYAAMHALQGDIAGAAALFLEVETACERHEEQWILSYAVWGRGLVSFHAGELDEAEASMLQSIAQKRPFRDVLGLALALDVLAWTLAALGDAAYDEEVRQGAAVPLDDTLRGLLDQDGSRRGSSPTSPAARRTDSVLTRREQEVARLVAEGLTNQEIAERLVISTRTRRGPRRERPPQARLPLAHADRHVVRGSG